MKKTLALVLCLLTLSLLTACAGGGKTEADRLPKAFGVIKNGARIEKHGVIGESASFAEEDFENALGSGLTYITVEELPDPDDGALMFRGAGVIKGQTVPASLFGYLRYLPNGDSASGSFGFSCDAAGWEGARIQCALTFTESENHAPVASDGEAVTVAGIAAFGEITLFDPDGDDVAVSVSAYPKNGSVEISASGSLIYLPEAGFSGEDSLVYTLTDKYGARSNEATFDLRVEENESGLVFADMEEDPAHLAAYRLCSQDIMTYKYKDGEYIFEPDEEVTRVDFLVMLMCAAGYSDEVNAVAESVISDGDGLSSGIKGFLAAAASKGILRTDNGAFRPDAVITFAEAAVMVSGAIGSPDTENGDGNGAALTSLVRDRIIDSTDNVGRALTRRECAVLLDRTAEFIKSSLR